MRTPIRQYGHQLARVLSLAVNLDALALVGRIWDRLYSYALARRFRTVGRNCFIEYPAVILGEKHISLGDNFHSYARLRLEAYDRHRDSVFKPCVSIGDNVSINYDCHIACINLVAIGDAVLIGSKVHITDHSHGHAAVEALATPPAWRPLVSKGPVIIEDNVWIGEGAVVLPGVTIGANSIIGANAVVTKDIPGNCVAAGVPAQVIRRLDPE